jgi:beta-phosphoglucomutase-like phosphatase (HAD superfamily)
MIIEVKALLFDNDGVLVDSHANVEKCWAQWAEEFGIKGLKISDFHWWDLKCSKKLTTELMSSSKSQLAKLLPCQALENYYPIFQLIAGQFAPLPIQDLVEQD